MRQVRIAYKSQIKIKKLKRDKIDNSIFVINQAYNWLIDFFEQEENQQLLIEADLASIKPYNDSTKIVLIKYQKIVTKITPIWKKYAEVRNLKTKGLSKPIQTKMLDFVKTYNKHNWAPFKELRFKISSKDSSGSFVTDSSISLKKIKTSTCKNGKLKRKTLYFVKIGKELYEFRNSKLNIKKFDLKTVTVSRKNGKYYISLSGFISVKQITSPQSKVGIDVNFENISMSDGSVEKLNNMQNKLNLFTKRLEILKQKQSKRQEFAKAILKEKCTKDKIDMYNGKRLTREAKILYRSILSHDKIYKKLKKQINNMYEKRTLIQDDLYKKLANKLMKNYDLCFVEDLDIENMVNGLVNNQNLYNASLGKLLLTIKNKARTSGKIVIEVDSHHTSKTCSYCGNIQDLELRQRSWTCEACKAKHDRDINAAQNILQRGLKYINTLGPEYKVA